MANYDELFTFKGGDVNLIANYKGTTITGKVATQAMVLASPVWDKFIFPPYTPLRCEDEPSDEPSNEVSNELALVRIQDPSPATADIKQIDCREDSGEALLILLRIAHVQFGEFLEKVTFDNLSNLAILCEEYDCHRLISPWSGMWIDRQWDVSKQEETPDERWLYIAWSFGRQDIFDEVTVSLIKCIHLSNTGEPLRASKPIREPAPEKILEHILGWRGAIVKHLLDIPYKCLDQFHNGIIICKRGSAKCDAIIYGSLAIQLTQVGLWPKVDPHSYPKNVNHLASILTSISVAYYPSTRTENSHSSCRILSFKERVNSLLVYISRSDLECHKNHMEMRSRSDYLRKITVEREEDGGNA